MLLKIDKPQRTATLHDDACSQVPRPVGTAFKAVEELGRDGGWFSVATEMQAQEIAARQFERAQFAKCQRCHAS